MRLEILLLVVGLYFAAAASVTNWSKVIVDEPDIEFVDTFPDEKNPSLRIVGGKPAKRNQFPYQVGLKLNILPDIISSWCGGSLIDKKWILTAAHCLLGNKYEVLENGSVIKYTYEYSWAYSLIAYIGGTDLDKKTDFQEIDVYSNPNFIIHQHYNPRRIENDIALVHLPEEAKLNEFAQLISLPPADIGLLENEMVVSSGWGISNDKTGETPKILQYANLKIMEIEKCKEIYSTLVVGEKQMCIDASQKKNTCQGDSGGPSVYEMNDGKKVVVGITSFGAAAACTAGYPSVLTRVSYYLDWIDDKKRNFNEKQ